VPAEVCETCRDCAGAPTSLFCATALVVWLRSLLVGSESGLQQRFGSAQGCALEMPVCGIEAWQIVVASPI
jgi:hypothetical protein